MSAAGDGRAGGPKQGIRVAVQGDTRLFSDGLRQLLAEEPGVVLVDHVGPTAPSAGIREGEPHVVLLDGRSRDAIRVSRGLRHRAARPWAIVVGAAADDESVIGALALGVRGVLPASATAETLLDAIRAVHAGRIWASQTALSRVVERFAEGAPAARADDGDTRPLSPREREVARHVIAGLSNLEVARRLGIREATVKAHLTHVFQKLGVCDRRELLASHRRDGNGEG